MREARLIETAEIPVAEIEAGHRLRPVNPRAIEALKASIAELGRITDPIHVRRVRHRDNRLVLIAGAHRLAAARELGWDAIPAHVWDCSDDWADLLEIDDNLVNDDLDPLDRAVFMAERKKVYIRLHPETRQGLAGAYSRWEKDALSTASFASVAAAKMRLTERQVRRLIAAGEHLEAEEIELLRTAPRPATLKDLQDLAKIVEVKVRKAAVLSFARGNAKTVVQAVKALKAPPARQPDPVDKAWLALRDRFDRAPMAAKRAFVRSRMRDLQRLIAEEMKAAADRAGEAAE